ncbi:hypothetical protein NPIL_74381 [Nephila pilipes]|uniref:Transmembrane protein n=1 Tax=Nephila pilipes TaxID=299642 RepID=A0A8X6PUH8_NEPPI|nr:hypothetical protein NPIL_74381 [Nephila pilipes]
MRAALCLCSRWLPLSSDYSHYGRTRVRDTRRRALRSSPPCLSFPPQAGDREREEEIERKIGRKLARRGEERARENKVVKYAVHQVWCAESSLSFFLVLLFFFLPLFSRGLFSPLPHLRREEEFIKSPTRQNGAPMVNGGRGGRFLSRFAYVDCAGAI